MSNQSEVGLYKCQAAKTPSLTTLRDIASHLGFDIPDHELPEYLGKRSSIKVNVYMRTCMYQIL